MSPRDNERLEYLGDAVLQLITAEYLFKLKPGAKEGEMTQLRSAMADLSAALLLGTAMPSWVSLSNVSPAASNAFGDSLISATTVGVEVTIASTRPSRNAKAPVR